MESQLSQYYAVAKERFPTARAISIMSGIQTVDGVPPLEWWTVLVYSTPIAPGATVIAQCSGDTFEEALELAVKKLAPCSHSWAASYDADDKVDGFDCYKCGAHQDHKEAPDDND